MRQVESLFCGGGSCRALAAVLILCCALTGCITPVYHLPPAGRPFPPAPQNVYDEVSGAMEDGDVYSVITLKSGDIALSKDFTIKIEPGTRAGLWVRIRGGLLEEGRLDLTKAVGFRYQTYPPVFVRQLRVNDTGRVDPLDLHMGDFVGETLFLGLLPQVRTFVRNTVVLNTSAYELMHGNIFARPPPPSGVAAVPSPVISAGSLSAMAHPALLDQVPATGRSRAGDQSPLNQLMERVEVRVPRVRLREGAVFRLTNFPEEAAPADCSGTRIVLDRDTTFEIARAEIDPDKSSIKAAISLELHCLDSVIEAKGQSIKLASGSRLLATGMTFESRKDDWSFTSAGGYLGMTLAAGEFRMEGANLSVGAGSRFSIGELKLSGSKTGGLEISGCGSIDLAIDGGKFRFNDSQLLLDKGGRLAADVTAALHQGEWRLAGRVRTLDLPILRGDFSLADAAGSRVAIQEGSRVLSSNLALDSAKAWNLTGTIDLARLNAIDGNVHFMKDSHLALGADSRLVLSEVVVSDQEPHLSGRIAVNLYAVGGKVDLANGTFFTVARDTKMEARLLRIDSSAGNLLSGEVETLQAVTAGGVLALGGRSKLDIASGSRVTLSSLEVPHDGVAFKGVISAGVAVAGGQVYFGNGNQVNIVAGSQLTVHAMKLDNTTPNKIFGQVDELKVHSTQGEFRLNATSALGTRTGELTFAPLDIPATGDDYTGNVRVVVDLGPGKVGIGPLTATLLAGKLDASVAWPGQKKVNGDLKELSYTVAVSGTDGSTAPRLAMALTNAKVEGSYDLASPTIRADGHVSCKALDDIVQKPSFEVVSGDHNQFHQTAKLEATVAGGWSLDGNIAWGIGQQPTLTLGGTDVSAHVSNVSHNGNRDGVKVHDDFHTFLDFHVILWWDRQLDIPVSGHIDGIELRPGEAHIHGSRFRLGQEPNVNLESQDIGDWIVDQILDLIVDIKAKAKEIAEQKLNDKVRDLKLGL